MYTISQHLLIYIIGFGVMTFGSHLYAQDSELIGSVTLEEVVQNEKIFQIYIDRYQPNESAVKYLNSVQDSLKLIVFIGTWCRESKKYIPGLIKTIDAASSAQIRVDYIGVDAQKKSPESFLKTFEIKYIPTVVVLKGNKEIGRIEEAPQQLIENDLVTIISEKAQIEN
ncbi:MAG: thioredoxin family protein [Balneolaceae bacterium]